MASLRDTYLQARTNLAARQPAAVQYTPPAYVTPIQDVQQPLESLSDAEVLGVHDGDTVTIRHPKTGKPVQVRMRNTDAPEELQRGGIASRDALRAMIGSNRVRADLYGTDNYGRSTGKLYIGDKELNLAQVQGGNAYANNTFGRNPVYDEAAAPLKAAGQGIYAKDAQSPEAFRAAHPVTGFSADNYNNADELNAAIESRNDGYFKKALRATLRSSLGGVKATAADIADVAGGDTIAKSLRASALRDAGVAAAYGANKQFKDINSIDDAAGWAAQSVGSAAGSVLPMATMAAIGALSTRVPGLRFLGPKAAARIAGIGTMGAMNTGEVSLNAAQDKDVMDTTTAADRLGTALTHGAVATALDVGLGAEGHALNTLTGEAGKQLRKAGALGLATQVGKDAVRHGFNEGWTEGAQNISEQLAGQHLKGGMDTSKIDWAQVGENAAGGAVGGGAIGGISAPMNSTSNPAKITPAIAAQAHAEGVDPQVLAAALAAGHKSAAEATAANEQSTVHTPPSEFVPAEPDQAAAPNSTAEAPIHEGQFREVRADDNAGTPPTQPTGGQPQRGADWQAAYQMALDWGENEADAVTHADQVVAAAEPQREAPRTEPYSQFGGRDLSPSEVKDYRSTASESASSGQNPQDLMLDGALPHGVGEAQTPIHDLTPQDDANRPLHRLGSQLEAHFLSTGSDPREARRQAWHEQRRLLNDTANIDGIQTLSNALADEYQIGPKAAMTMANNLLDYRKSQQNERDVGGDNTDTWLARPDAEASEDGTPAESDNLTHEDTLNMQGEDGPGKDASTSADELERMKSATRRDGKAFTDGQIRLKGKDGAVHSVNLVSMTAEQMKHDYQTGSGDDTFKHDPMDKLYRNFSTGFARLLDSAELADDPRVSAKDLQKDEKKLATGGKDAMGDAALVIHPETLIARKGQGGLEHDVTFGDLRHYVENRDALTAWSLQQAAKNGKLNEYSKNNSGRELKPDEARAYARKLSEHIDQHVEWATSDDLDEQTRNESRTKLEHLTTSNIPGVAGAARQALKRIEYTDAQAKRDAAPDLAGEADPHLQANLEEGRKEHNYEQDTGEQLANYGKLHDKRSRSDVRDHVYFNPAVKAAGEAAQRTLRSADRAEASGSVWREVGSHDQQEAARKALSDATSDLVNALAAAGGNYENAVSDYIEFMDQQHAKAVATLEAARTELQHAKPDSHAYTGATMRYEDAQAAMQAADAEKERLGGVVREARTAAREKTNPEKLTKLREAYNKAKQAFSDASDKLFYEKGEKAKGPAFINKQNKAKLKQALRDIVAVAQSPTLAPADVERINSLLTESTGSNGKAYSNIDLKNAARIIAAANDLKAKYKALIDVSTRAAALEAGRTKARDAQHDSFASALEADTKARNAARKALADTTKRQSPTTGKADVATTLMNEILQQFSPNSDLQLWFVKDGEARLDTNAGVLVLPANMTAPAMRNAVLDHMGTWIVHNELSRADSATRDELRNAWQKDVNGAPTFTQYVADQLRAYISDRHKADNSFFRSVVDKLKSFFKDFVKRAKPDESFAKYFDKLVAKWGGERANGVATQRAPVNNEVADRMTLATTDRDAQRARVEAEKAREEEGARKVTERKKEDTERVDGLVNNPESQMRKTAARLLFEALASAGDKKVYLVSLPSNGLNQRAIVAEADWLASEGGYQRGRDEGVGKGEWIRNAPDDTAEDTYEQHVPDNIDPRGDPVKLLKEYARKNGGIKSGRPENDDLQAALGIDKQTTKASKKLFSKNGRGSMDGVREMLEASSHITAGLSDSEVAAVFDGKEYSKVQTGTKPMSLDSEQAVKDYIEKTFGGRVKQIITDTFGHSGSFDPAVPLVDPVTKRVISTERVVYISRMALDPMGVARHEAMHAFFSEIGDTVLGQKAMRTLRDVAMSRFMQQQLRERLAGQTEALAQLDDADEAVAYMYQFWGADKGGFKLAPAAATWFSKLKEVLNKVLGAWTSDKRATEIMQYLDSGKHATGMHELNAVTKALFNSDGPGWYRSVSDIAQPLYNKLRDGVVWGDAQMRKMNVPQMTQIADLIKREIGDPRGGAEGLLSARTRQRGRFMAQVANSLSNGTDVERADAERALATGTMKAQTANGQKMVDEVRATMDAMHDYLEQAGMQVPKVKNYYPRVWDFDKISKNREKFLDMLVRNGIEQTAAEGVFDSIGRGDTTELHESENEVGYTPAMAAAKKRALRDIPAADAAEFVNNDLINVVTTYIHQAVSRAEYVRRFGVGGVKLEALIKQARKNGASDEQVAYARRYVMAAEGTLGSDMNPNLKEAMGAMVTLGNFRLLATSLFSQLPDVAGLALRSGSISDGVKAFRSALADAPKYWKENTLGTDGKQRELTDGEKLAIDLGVLDHHAMMSAMGNVYEGEHMSVRLRKLNDKFFSANGMVGWNNSMRVAATEAAVRYIQRSNEGGRKADLRELGLEGVKLHFRKDGSLVASPSELKDMGATQDEIDAVGSAVNRFVDSAILRPDAAVRPVWMSDPRWMLVAHLKQFSYTFHATILNRTFKRCQETGSMMPAVQAAMLYLPAGVLTVMMKGAIMGGGDEPEYMKRWGATDYAWAGFQRSGLLGVRQYAMDAENDVSRGNNPAGDLLGPTAQFVSSTIRDVSKGDVKHALVNSLPANDLYSAHLLGR